MTLEVPAPAAGVLGDILAKDGETVARRRACSARSSRRRRQPRRAKADAKPPAPASAPPRRRRPSAAAPAPAAQPATAAAGAGQRPGRGAGSPPRAASIRRASPAPARTAASTKGDMLAAIAAGTAAPPRSPRRRRAARRARPSPRRRRGARGARADDAAAPDHRAAAQGGAEHRRDADDLQRGRHDRGDGAAQRSTRTLFEKKHGVKLGFMGFFVRPCVAGAEGRSRRSTPRSTATTSSTRTTTTSASPSAPTRAWSCRWCATPTGCRSPTSRRRSPTSASSARDGKLTIDDLQGGTFTITNGGVFGSLMSTPILNPPQSGILGMHSIQERPVVRDGADRRPPDDVPRALLRPPHRRRQGGGDASWCGSRRRSRTRRGWCWICERRHRG